MSETIRGLKEILLKLNELHSVLLEENSNTIPLLSDSVVNLIRLVSTSTHNLRSYVSSVDIKEADLVDCLAKVEKIAKIQKQEILSLKKDFIREKDNATTMTEFFPCCECSKKDFFIYALVILSPAVMWTIERGNSDLFIFFLCFIYISLLQRNNIILNIFSYILIFFSSYRRKSVILFEVDSTSTRRCIVDPRVHGPWLLISRFPITSFHAKSSCLC